MTQAPRLRLHLDDRGMSRQLLDLWLPHFGADAVWIVGAEIPDEDWVRAGVPLVSLSVVEAAAAAQEHLGNKAQALVVFTSIADLADAADMGLPVSLVTLQHLAESEDTERLGASVHINRQDLATCAALRGSGFSFEIKSLPNITARVWHPSPEESH